jgi:uncharacterized membrane protein YgcG
MWASFGSLSVVSWLLLAQMSPDMSAVPVITAAQPPSKVMVEVRDRAEVFSSGAERRAKEALWRIHRKHRAAVRIETIESLDGAWIADVAGQRARMAEAEQLYVLVAGGERDVGVIAARQGPASHLTDQERGSIRRAFLAPLQAGEADGALEQGVGAIGATLDHAAASQRGFSGWEARIAVTILVAALTALLASLARARSGVKSRRRRRTAAGATTIGDVGGPFPGTPRVSRVPQSTPTCDMGGPRCTARSPARCPEQVEA